MLKRNDLAKQFELVVQQEIKNHNDQMLATNLAVNELRLDIDKISKSLHLSTSLHDSNIKIRDVQDEHQCDVINKLLQKLDSHINDQRILNERNSKEDLDKVEAIDRLFKMIEKLTDKLSSLSEYVQVNSDSISSISESMHSSLESLERKNAASLKNFKNEIASLPSEAQEVKKELQKQMSIDRVDFTGLLKELRGYKKENFIIDKKFEHIYTLIERLDKRISK